MVVTIRSLLAEPDLQLTLLGDPQGLDREVHTVAVSELPDPTPWLQGAELLLTSGMWLAGVPNRAQAIDAWAKELALAGVHVVGFGLEPWFAAVPAEIVDAAAHHRLTLLEVPPQTPFVAVDRRVADLHAANARQRQTEVVRAQQRLATAGRSGRSAVVRTLARELGGWVVTLDTAYRIEIHVGDLHGVNLDELVGLAHRATREGRPNLLTGDPDRLAYLVSIGGTGTRYGTLCVDGRAVTADAAGRAGLVDTAAAILSVMPTTLNRSVEGVVVELLLEGDDVSAHRVCEAAGQLLPKQLIVASLSGAGARHALREAISLGMWPVPAKHGLLVVGEAALVEARLPELLEETRARAGISAAHSPVDLSRAVQEAASAQRLAGEDQRIVRYRSASALERLLAAEPSRQLAKELLAPLAGHPERDILLASAAAWVQAHGRWDPAAGILGIHRVTLRGRLRRLEKLLALDLDSPYDRLALSLALEALPGDGNEGRSNRLRKRRPGSPAATVEGTSLRMRG